MLSPGQFLGLFLCLALLYGTFPYHMDGWLVSSGQIPSVKETEQSILFITRLFHQLKV
jgi:hypothetical protein